MPLFLTIFGLCGMLSQQTSIMATPSTIKRQTI